MSLIFFTQTLQSNFKKKGKMKKTIMYTFTLALSL